MILHRLVPAAAALAGTAIGLVWGYVSYRFEYPPYALAQQAFRAIQDRVGGRPLPYRHLGRRRALEDAGRDRLRRLESLGYLGAVEVAEASGVTVHDSKRTWPGPRLLSLGHAPEAQLIAPDGRVLRKWTQPFEDAFPELADLPAVNLGARYWRKILPLDDGGLLAIHDYIGLVRLDADSGLVWARANGAHHDVVPSGKGTFYCLTARRERVEWFDPDQEIQHDYVIEIDPSGHELWRISLLEALRDSPYASLLNRVEGREDPTHANSLQVLDGRHAARQPAFRDGALLTSWRYAGAIFVVDPVSGRAEWALAGLFSFQHAPKLLDSGNILLFDNYGDSSWRGADGERRYGSRALELDPLTLQIAWNHDSRYGELFSACCGAAQRLPNGNTLITETDNGRVFEVTSEHEVVWEYYTPVRQDDYIARVMDAVAVEGYGSGVSSDSSSGSGSRSSISSNEIVASAENLR